MKENRRRQKRGRQAAALLLAASLAGSLTGGNRVYAMFDEERAVHIRPDEIENATVAVGTHLIYLDALNDENYEIAKASAEDAAQTEVYYKSELGGGAWYRISAAGSLRDITENGEPVGTEEIEALFFTHHTKSDGITYDLTTGEAVNPFEIRDPCDLQETAELEALLRQYEILQENSKKSEAAEYRQELLEEFLETDAATEGTAEKDEQMAALYGTYRILAQQGADSETLSALMEVMGKVDAGRRYEVMERLGAELETLSERMLSPGEEFSGDYESDAAMNEAIAQAQSEVENAALIYGGERLGQADTVSEQVREELCRNVIMACGEDGQENVLGSLGELEALARVMDGTASGTEEEKNILKERILPQTERALAEHPDSAPLEAEYSFYSELLAELEGEKEAEKENGELAELYAQRQELKSARLAALEQNDLKQAKELEAQIDETEERIGELENGEADGAKAGAAAKAEKLKQSALSLIEDAKQRDMEEIQAAVEGLDALCGSSPRAAGKALKELHEKMKAQSYLEDTSVFDGLLAEIEASLAQLPGMAQELSGEEILAVTGTPGPAALIGLSMYGAENASEEAEALLEETAAQLAETGDPLIFGKLAGPQGGGYAPAKQVAQACGLRFLESGRQQGALVRGSSYYGFCAYSDRVEREGGKTDQLDAPALYQEALYLPSGYVEQEFGYAVYSLGRTGYAVLADEAALAEAERIYGELQTKGGD